MSTRRAVFAVLLAVLLAAAMVVAGTRDSARAASVQEVTGFGTNPGNLQMFRYVPAGLPSGRPVVVAMHGCTQNAAGYGGSSGWTQLADAWGFAVLLPQQKSANNANSCFNWFEPGDTTRGSGEALSIKQMIDRMTGDLGSSPVYVTGLSAGAAMTAVLLATYPEVFAGGGIVAGLPYGCANSVSTAFNCMNPGVDLTPAQWGDKVRAAASYSGPRAKVSIWHGTADTTVRPINGAELVDQWTDVLGTDHNPEVSDTVAGYPHKVYGSVVESYEITGMNHGQPVDPGSGTAQCGSTAAFILDVNICAAYHMAQFWGLIGGSPPPPPTTTTTTTTTTTSAPPPACFTDNNFNQVAAGRAHTSGGNTFANGSNQAMGLYNVFVTHTLKQTAPGSYIIADAGCP